MGKKARARRKGIRGQIVSFLYDPVASLPYRFRIRREPPASTPGGNHAPSARPGFKHLVLAITTSVPPYRAEQRPHKRHATPHHTTPRARRVLPHRIASQKQPVALMTALAATSHVSLVMVSSTIAPFVWPFSSLTSLHRAAPQVSKTDGHAIGNTAGHPRRAHRGGVYRK